MCDYETTKERTERNRRMKEKGASKVGFNMFTYPVSNGVVLYSYDTRVVYKDSEGIYWITEKEYSKTTTKQIRSWINWNKIGGKVSQEFLNSL